MPASTAARLVSGSRPERIWIRATLNVEAFAMLMRYSLRLFLGRGEQRVELAGFVQRIKIVAAADMGRADENLRIGAPAAGALDHLFAYVPVSTDVDLVEAYTLSRQQVLRILTIGAVANGIDVDRGHDDAKGLVDWLYGRSPRIGNPGENQHIDIGGAGAQQSPGAAVDRSAGSEHVVDEDQPAAGDGGLALVRHAERALDIGGALRPRQPDLLRRRLDALQRRRGDRDAAVRRNGGRQNGRLIEAPRPEPAPMQRHRYQRVGLGQKLAAGVADP